MPTPPYHTAWQRYGYLLLFSSVLLLAIYTLVMIAYTLQFLSPSLLPNQTLGSLANTLLDIVVIGGLIGGACYAFTSDLELRLNLQIWCIGLLLILPRLLFPEHYIIHSIYLNIGCPIAIVSLSFWLMQRFSRISADWANLGVRVVAGELALAGVALTLAQISPQLFGYAAAIIVPSMVSIFAAHSYRALSDHNQSQTLSAHWYALGVLLFLLGTGFLGSVLSLPEVSRAVEFTHLPALQTTLTRLTFTTILVGLANQIAAELRASNRRVTGLMPFWLVSFGIIIGSIGLGGAGLVQAYLLSLLHMDIMQVHVLLRPLYVLWGIGQGLMALGIGIYILTFWLRRPSNILSNITASSDLLE